MSGVEINRRPRPFSAGLATAALAVVGFAVAASWGLSTGGLALVAFAGTALFVRGVTLGTADPDATTNGQWALASVAIAAGATVALAPLFQYGPREATLVYPFVAGVAFAGVGSTSATVGDRSRYVASLCWRSAHVLGLAVVVSVAIHTGAITVTAATSAVLGRALVVRNAMLSLLALEGLLLALVVVLPRAQQVLEAEVATPEARRLARVTVDGRRVDRVLPALRRRLPEYWWVFAGQVVLFAVYPGVLDAILASVPVFGPAVAWVLASGLLHLVVAGLVSLAVVVLGGSLVRRAILSWADVDPPRMLASAAGGVVLSALVMLPGHLLAGEVTDLLFGGASVTRTAGVYGPAALVLVSLALVLFAAPVVLLGADLIASMSRLTTERSGAFALAATMGLTGVVVATLRGVPALIVFAGVAASLLAWEFGHQASYLGAQVGAAVGTREVEVVHAVAALAVGVAGVALAALVGYVVGPVDLPAGSDRASLALALALLSAVSFVLALDG